MERLTCRLPRQCPIKANPGSAPLRRYGATDPSPWPAIHDACGCLDATRETRPSWALLECPQGFLGIPPRPTHLDGTS